MTDKFLNQSLLQLIVFFLKVINWRNLQRKVFVLTFLYLIKIIKYRFRDRNFFQVKKGFFYMTKIYIIWETKYTRNWNKTVSLCGKLSSRKNDSSFAMTSVKVTKVTLKKEKGAHFMHLLDELRAGGKRWRSQNSSDLSFYFYF